MKNTIVKLFVLTMFCFGANGLQAQTVKDIDGNVYKTVTIGIQVWMAENLKTTRLNDGTLITIVTDNDTWSILNTPAYCYYKNDDKANKNKYGALYNWFTVSTNKLCPVGWHVPTDTEWTTLIDYLKNNGFGFEGNNILIGKSMATTSDWIANATDGAVGNDQLKNNKSGFSAPPSGWRKFNIKTGFDAFNSLGNEAYWWSSTEQYNESAWSRKLQYNGAVSRSNYYKRTGFSVRCLKDK